MRFDTVVNNMAAKAAASNSIDLCGGDQWRPFVHVRDVAKAVILAMEADDRLVRGEVFNVGSTDSNYQIAEVAGINLEEMPGTKLNQTSTVVDKRNYNCIFDKIHKKLNYKCTLSVRDGIREIGQFVQNEKPDLSSPEYNNY